MADATEKILFEIRLDKSQYEQESKLIRESLVDTEKKILATKEAQQKLSQQYKEGAITADNFAKESVKYRTQLRGQQADQRELTKGLEALEKTYNSAAGSVDQLKARSAELTTQYNAMSEAERTTTDEGKALTTELNQVNEALKGSGEQVGDFRRNVGNYSASFKQGLEPLIVELAKVREQQKGLDQDSEGYQVLEKRAIGFQTAAVKAGAQAGLSFEQAEAKVVDYTAKIQPAIENLVRLEKEQENVGEGSEAFRKIGFQIAAVEKELQQVPAETKKVSAALVEAADTTGVLGGVTRQYSEAKAKLTAVTNLAKSATLAEVGALGLLKIALAATGIGLFVLALGAVVTFLTKTQTGIDFLEQKTKGLGIVMGVLTDKVSAVGEVLFKAFDNPKQAVSDLLDFIGTNLLNRLKAFGVIVEGIVGLNPRKIGEGFLQASTGIVDATAKAQAFTKELGNAAKAGQQIAAESQRIRDLEREITQEREKSKAQIEALKLIEQDTSKSTAERLKAGREAFALEEKSAARQQQLQKDRIANIEREQALTNNLTADNEALSQEKIKLYALERDSNTRRIELNNQLNAIQKAQSDKEKADAKARADAAAKAAEQRLADTRAQLKLENDLIDQQLRKTPAGSDNELHLLEKKLSNQRQIELAQKSLTIGQKKLLEEKYQNDVDELILSHTKQRIDASLQQEAAVIAARLVAVKTGSDEELRLQQQAIEKRRQQQLQAISETATAEERAAQEQLINAQADKQQTDLVYSNRSQAASKFYDEQRNKLDQAHAEGLGTEQQYSDALYQQELGRLSAQLAIAKSFGQDTAAIEQQLFELKIGHIDQVTQKDRAAKQQQLDTARSFGEQLGELFTQTISETGGQLQDFAAGALVILLDSLEKAVLAATVEATAKTIAQLPFPLGIAAAAGEVALIKAAFGAVKAGISKPTPKVFQLGGVVQGPGHAQGGVPMYHKSGAYVGEMEGREIILTRGVYDNPFLRSIASLLNAAGGGRPFAHSLSVAANIPRHYAEGGIVRYDPAVMDPMRAGINNTQVIQQPIDYDLLAAKLAPAFVAGAQSLPAPVVQPTEFNRAADNERRVQAQSNH